MLPASAGSSSLHFSVLDRLQIEPLLAARPKPLKSCEIVADGAELMGQEPKVLVDLTASRQ